METTKTTILEYDAIKVNDINEDGTRSYENKKECNRFIIKGFATDLLNLYMNIRVTSLSNDDFRKRINDMCEKFGINYNEIQDKFY